VRGDLVQADLAQVPGGGGAYVDPDIRTISIISPPPRNGGSAASRS
jgi:hypothetical protein